MKIAAGIDLVYIPRFRAALKSGEKFLQRIYLREELNDENVEHLAGIFAAKEAIMKALSLPTDSWHDIYVTYKPDGAPLVEFLNHKSSIINHSLSISHDGSYVIAQFVAMLKK